MEANYLFLCFVLITSVVCFDALDAIPEHAKDVQTLDASSKRCKCENGKCVTDKLGRTKCVCKPGFALQDEFTCRPCDCGSLGKCIFLLKPIDIHGDHHIHQYQKKCICDEGCAEKDGVCVDCFCGEKSSCDFDHGERRCYCIQGYAEKNGVCTQCDCGYNGECEYEDGIKKCTCDEGFADLNGTCEVCNCGDHGTCSFDGGKKTCKCESGFLPVYGKCKECDCGSNSENCEFVNGIKRCNCKDRYADKNGTCEECYCGYNGKCEYDDGIKKCLCNEGFSELNGLCEICDCGDHGTCSFEKGEKTCKCKLGFVPFNGKCETCDCGSNSDYCEFVDGVKRCGCKVGYADRYGTCEECNCGEYTRSCNFKENQKTCTCLIGYVQKGETCEIGCSAKSPCQNGGHCKDGFCFCQKGTRGQFCDVIDECPNLCPNTSNSKCSYDVSAQKAYCKCYNNNLRYNPNTRQCRRICKDDRSCRNNGKCTGVSEDKFCVCPEGAAGDFCDEVPVCKGLRCGPDADCVLDPSTKKAACACRIPKHKFDRSVGKCRYVCDTNSECYNGGVCVMNNYCYCMPGTQGDRCEIVNDCHYSVVKCNAQNAYCAFDVTQRKATCKCKNWNEQYDATLGICRGSCKSHADCYNGGSCGFGGLCTCLPGTQGTRCEIVNDCYFGRIQCYGGRRCCAFNLRTFRGVCLC